MAPKVSVAGLFEEHSPLDNLLRLVVIVGVLGYVVFESTVFSKQYDKRAVELYSHPWWRLALVGLVGLGAWWCPRVGLALAVAVYFYLNDMQILTSPFK